MSEWFEAEEHADRALDMYERGRWAEAEAELRKALSLNPDQPEWHFNLGLTLEASERDSEALRCYERAVDLMPGQVDPLLAAGLVANRLGHFEQASEWFRRALRVDARCELAYAHQIESHLRRGEHDDAETAFYLSQLMLEDPSAHCLAMIAESLMQRGRYDRAEWCLWQALRLDPAIPRLRAKLGAVYAATGRPQRALQMFLRDLRDDPGNIDTLLEYGEALMDLERLPEAGEKFRRVLELEPANVDAHYRLGEIALRSGRSEQAHLEFELVLKLDPQYPQVRTALAEALVRRRQAPQARPRLREELDLLQAAEDGGDAGRDLPRLGAILLEADMPADAAMVLARALQERGESPDLLRRLALARYRAGERRLGLGASRRVLRLDPKCVSSIHNLALAALDQGRLRVAAGWIARGMRVDRHDDGLRRLRVRLWLAWVKGNLLRVSLRKR